MDENRRYNKRITVNPLKKKKEAEWRNVGVLNENIISCWCCINLLNVNPLKIVTPDIISNCVKVIHCCNVSKNAEGILNRSNMVSVYTICLDEPQHTKMCLWGFSTK